MNDMPLITVIVPVYNILNYLPRCVASITAQTYRNLEIILVDDGSTDGTGELCDTLASGDGRLPVYHKENGGSSSARNLALQYAHGEYVGFVDSDDFIEPDMYEHLLEGIRHFSAAAAQAGRDEIDEAGNRLPNICEPPEKSIMIESEKSGRTASAQRGLLLLHEINQTGFVPGRGISRRSTERGLSPADQDAVRYRGNRVSALAGLSCILSDGK